MCYTNNNYNRWKRNCHIWDCFWLHNANINNHDPSNRSEQLFWPEWKFKVFASDIPDFFKRRLDIEKNLANRPLHVQFVQRTNGKVKVRFTWSLKPEKTADIWRRYHWFSRQMTSEKRAQKFHNDDASLPRAGWCFWLVESHFLCGTTNQKHYPNLGSDVSSVWNFCARFSDVIWRENQW